MRTADLLEELTLEQVRAVARRFDIPTAGYAKGALISRVARALPKMLGTDGAPLGWSGSLYAVIATMQKAELVRAIEGSWCSDDGRTFDTTGAVNRRTVEDLQELLRDLAIAGDEDPSVTTADVALRPRWADCFREVTIGAEGGADGEDEVLAYDLEPPGPPPAALVGGDEGLDRQDARPDLEHQAQAMQELARWRPRGQHGVLCMPTGSGKTRTAVRFLMRHALDARSTVLWLAHRSELVDQAVQTLVANRHLAGRPVEIGRFQKGSCKVDRPVDVVVASIPTLAHGANMPNLRRLVASQSPRRIGLVVVDECHHAVARTWRAVLKALQSKHAGAQFLGLSATPTRSSDEEASALWRLFERIIFEAHPLELMRRRVLARPKFIGVPTNETFTATEQQRAEFVKFHDLPTSLVRAIAEQQSRNARIAEYFVNNARQLGRTLIFAATIAQATSIDQLLRRAGVASAVLSAKSSAEERAGKSDAFARGALQVLVNVSLFSEGTDLPAVSSVLIARPTTSRILFAQMVGRGLRGPAVGGTEECTIVSFYDVVTNLAVEQFATTFQEEQEALEALGLAQPPGDEDVAPASVMPPTSQRAQSLEFPAGLVATEESLRLRMQALLDALTTGLRITRTFELTPVPLIGWWQVDAEHRRRYLPVYEPDQNVLARFVVGLTARRELTPPPVKCVPQEHVRLFAEKVVRTGAEPRFLQIESSNEEQKQAFARTMLLGGADWIPAEPALNPVPPDAPLAQPLPHDAAGGPSPVAPWVAPVAPVLLADPSPAPTSVSRVHRAAAGPLTGTPSPATPTPSPLLAIAAAPTSSKTQPMQVYSAPPAPPLSAGPPVAVTGTEGFVEVRLSSGTIALRHQDFEAVSRVWQGHRSLLPEVVDETTARLFVGMALRLPDLADVVAEQASAILAHACFTGELPPVVLPVAREEIGGVRRQALGIAPGGRRQWLQQVYESNYRGQYASMEDFLVALLDGGAE